MNIKVVAVGGASASGKSHLADQLRTVLAPHVPVFVFRQDRFFKPSDKIPIDPTTGFDNWDAPDALDWPALHAALRSVRSATSLDDLHGLWTTHDLGRDGQEEVRAGGPAPTASAPWHPPRDWLATVLNPTIDALVLIDGFLLFHDATAVEDADACVFVATGYATCHQRRKARAGYNCSDGVFWADPPSYFDDLVWPAYLKYNQRVLALLPPQYATAQLDEDGAVDWYLAAPTVVRVPDAPMPVLVVDAHARGEQAQRETVEAVIQHVWSA
ncbi:ribosylnicotinamide kinase [Allomyces javanicus]|nr:ribosylnicotinamide kinase [Allomyces javanicus]